MPIKTEWFASDTPQTIIHMQFSDPWTITDMNDHIAIAHAMMRSQSHTVNLIMNAETVKRPPQNIISAFVTRRDMLQIPENQGYVVVVAGSSFIRAMLYTAKRVLARFTQKMIVVNSMDEALEMLKNMKK